MRDFHLLGAYFARLFTEAILLKWPSAFIIGMLGYALPTQTIQRTALASVYLVLLDTVTGCVAARRGDGQAISSAKFARALVKLFAYFSVVSVAAVTTNELPFLQGLQGFTVSSILTIVILTEGISILENCRRMGINLRWLGKLLEAQLTGLEPAPKVAVVQDREETRR